MAVGNSEVEPILIELKHGSAGGVKRAFWRYDTIVVKGSETHWFEAPRTSLELVKQGEGDGRQRTQFRK